MPDIQELSGAWRRMLHDANHIAATLPEEHIGTCILTQNGALFKGTLDELQRAVNANALVFHDGAIRGAWPKPRSED